MKIQLFLNHCELEIVDLAEKMREAGIIFSSIVTSGPTILYTGVHSSHGVTAVKYAIHKLIEEKTMASTDIDGRPVVILTEGEAEIFYSHLVTLSTLTNTEQIIVRKIARDLELEGNMKIKTPEPVGGTFTLTVNGKTTVSLPCTASTEDIKNAIDELTGVKMKVRSDFNQKGTWRLSNEQLTIRVVVDADNNIQAVAPVAFKFIGQPLNNLAHWMNRMSKTDIMLLKKNTYRGHQYSPMDSEGLSGGRSHEGDKDVRAS